MKKQTFFFMVLFFLSLSLISFQSVRLVNRMSIAFTVCASDGIYYAKWASNNTVYTSSASLASVINSLNSVLSSGGSIYFQSGFYVSKDQWQITNNYVTISAEDSTTVDWNYPIPDSQLENCGLYITGSNVIVQGFIIENCSKSGIKAVDAKGILIRNNTIINTWTGITLESVNDSIIDSNIVNWTQGDGIYITGYYPTNDNSKNITVRNNQIYFVGDTGIDVSNGDSNIEFSSVTVKNNNIKRFNNATLSPTPNGGGISVGKDVDQFLIQNNTVDTMRLSVLANGANGTVTNNSLTNFIYGSGVWGTTSDNVSVTYNIIYSATASNSVFTDKAWTIAFNAMTVSGQSGDQAVTAKSAIVYNNTAYYSARDFPGIADRK